VSGAPGTGLDCLAVGAITADRYGDAVRIGGSAYYAARVFAGLGARARIATRTSAELLAAPALAGIETCAPAGDAAAVFVNLYGEGGARAQWIEAPAAPIDPRRLPALPRRADALLLCPVLGEVPLAAWLGAAPARVVGIGVQGFLRTAAATADRDGRRAVVAARFAPDPGDLARVDAAFLSEEDLALAEPGLLDRLRAAVPLVALTRGAAGARLFHRGGAAEIGIYPTTAVDPTGAGDAFAAACLLALASGEDPIAAARLGAAAASIVVEGIAGSELHRAGEAFARAERIDCRI